MQSTLTRYFDRWIGFNGEVLRDIDDRFASEFEAK